MRNFGIASLFVLLVAQPGCVSISGVSRAAKRAMQRCAIESEPSGATIRLNGQRVGTTPCEVGYPFGKVGRSDYRFSASLAGHRTKVQKFSSFPTYITFELEPVPVTYVSAANHDDILGCDLAALPELSERASVAVLDFRVGAEVPPEVGEALADFCRETVQDSERLTLVDRQNMRTLLTEEDFAATVQCDDTRCLVDFGKKLRAQKIVHGRACRVGEALVLTLKMIDVSSATVDAICNVKTTGPIEELLDLTGPATCQLLRDALEPDGTL